MDICKMDGYSTVDPLTPEMVHIDIAWLYHTGINGPLDFDSLCSRTNVHEDAHRFFCVPISQALVLVAD
jgi:hypothetical protein